MYQVIAAAQGGKHNDKRESYGDSLIIDPWGSVVGRLPGENRLTIFPMSLKGCLDMLLNIQNQGFDGKDWGFKLKLVFGGWHV